MPRLLLIIICHHSLEDKAMIGVRNDVSSAGEGFQELPPSVVIINWLEVAITATLPLLDGVTMLLEVSSSGPHVRDNDCMKVTPPSVDLKTTNVVL